MNPYSEETFFGFFVELFKRLILFMTGQLAWEHLAADEIQLLVLIGVAASTALLGCFLVLRKMTMLANSLSHTILLGIVIAYLITTGAGGGHDGTETEPFNITAMLWASLGMGIATTFLTEFLNKTVGLQEDASIGLVFSSLFAIGIILVTLLTRNAHIGTEVVMGNVDGLQLSDAKWVYWILIINVVCLFLFYKEFTVTTFDPGLSSALGISPTVYNYFLMTLLSGTAIAAFRAVGVLMVLSFLTGPVLSARLVTHHLRTLILLAVGFGAAVSLCGVALARHFLTVYEMPLSTGGIVVCLIAGLFGFIFLWKKAGGNFRFSNG